MPLAPRTRVTDGYASGVTEQSIPPPPGGQVPHDRQPPPDRHAVDVGAIERAVTSLEPVSESLRQLSTRLVHATSDPGRPPAADHVLDLQSAASDALFSLSRGLDESGGLLTLVARHYRGTEEEVERVLRRMSGEGA